MIMRNDLFSGRTIVIATKHAKEQIIAPLLEAAFGVKCITIPDFDTDTLGTFTGEIERTLNPFEAAKEKCRLAILVSGCDLAVASEGSFGPHPAVFFVAADDEHLVLLDHKNQLEIHVREVSVETNFNGDFVKTENELMDFAIKARFPSHGLILRKSKDDNEDIVKDIRNFAALKETFATLRNKHQKVYVETDMRAMLNPLRMNVIEKATQQLVAKMKSCCPQCETPGFDSFEVLKGLPCGLCNYPTKMITGYMYKCKKCNYNEERLAVNQAGFADPMHCDFCNP